MTEAEAPEHDDRRMTIGEHLEELRRRVIRSLIYLVAGVIVLLVFKDEIVRFILRQPVAALKELGHEGTKMQGFGPTEGFATQMKVVLMAAMLVTSPLIAREIWRFISAGLYPHERKYVEIFAPLSYVLFLAGIAFLYFVVIPPALKFLFTFGYDPEIVVPVPRYADYISFYFVMCLIMGIVFQLPLIMVFFSATGILAPAFFRKYRRHFIVGAVAVLAVLTPSGDAVTLLLVTIPVVLLYEGGILLSVLFRKRRETQA
jgi:sec-independent protein translocase protein TatC